MYLMSLQILIRSIYLQNLKNNVRRVCIFHLILVSIPFIVILSIKNRGGLGGGGGGVLNRQNPLAKDIKNPKTFCQKMANFQSKYQLNQKIKWHFNPPLGGVKQEIKDLKAGFESSFNEIKHSADSKFNGINDQLKDPTRRTS